MLSWWTHGVLYALFVCEQITPTINPFVDTQPWYVYLLEALYY